MHRTILTTTTTPLAHGSTADVLQTDQAHLTEVGLRRNLPYAQQPIRCRLGGILHSNWLSWAMNGSDLLSSSSIRIGCGARTFAS
jgi:hypothetical protein